MPHVTLLGNTVGPALLGDTFGVPLGEDSLDEDSPDPGLNAEVLGPIVGVAAVAVVLDPTEVDETQHLKLFGPGQKFLKE